MVVSLYTVILEDCQQIAYVILSLFVRGSRVVSVLDSVAEKPGFIWQSQKKMVSYHIIPEIYSAPITKRI